jgi:hypothetical protein
MNEAITFIDHVGFKDYAHGNFFKFGGGEVVHHGKPMVVDTLSIFVSSCLLIKSSLPFPKIKHDPPFIRVQNAVGYIILWPWKLTTTYMG